ncbi:MAG: polysaccharide biosynthesis protein [Deltaproteobacteria bacterium]|nr:polysaccharide biosynthesis protein [Deltaproteobacteria bacterium]
MNEVSEKPSSDEPRLPQILKSHLGLRRTLVVFIQIFLFTAAYAIAALLRFDFDLEQAWAVGRRVVLIVVGIQAAVFFAFGTHRGWLRYAGLHDLVHIGKAALTSFAVIIVFLGLAWRLRGASRSILLLDLVLTLLLIGGARLGMRFVREVIAPNFGAPKLGPRVLIVGAGHTGAALLAEILRNESIDFNVVGFVDDDPAKMGARIHNASVVGPIDALPDVVAAHDIDEVIIATPTASGKDMRRIVRSCQAAKVRYRRVPALEDFVHGRLNFNQIRDVNIDDLLRREPIQLDHTAIGDYLRARTVLVTGAAGSIGSEMCRQVARFSPNLLLLCERNENALFLLERELEALFPEVAVRPIIADITDDERMTWVFSHFRPDAVFHAAAHKHVPMMEANPNEAVKNNVFGTKRVADLADRFGCHTFVMISTDKAVNPTSVMGTTKRVAEIYVQELASKSKTKFVAVRFGNVLGSNGSVVPIFQEQIRRGGPITVTHPDMRRYFMTVPEAAQLVLQAAALGNGGEVFVLDMGEPMKIVDLARDLIRLSGLSEDEIGIEFTGMRPGEKLFEEIALSNEAATKTGHPKIWVGRVQRVDSAELAQALQRLERLDSTAPHERVVEALSRLVPEFDPPEGRADRAEGRASAEPVPHRTVTQETFAMAPE